MTITANTTTAGAIGTASTTVAKSLTSVPAGATVVLGILNRSDETTAISGISDDVDGAWTLNYVAGPVNSTNSTYRCWLAYRHNVTGGTTNFTVTFGGAINSQLAAGWLDPDTGSITFDAAATTYHSAAGETNVDSNTVATAGGGALVGFLTTNNSQSDPEPTADGAGESRITSGQGGARAFLFFEPYASSGTYGLETTVDSATCMFIVGAFLESGGGGGGEVSSTPLQSLGSGFGPARAARINGVLQ